MPTMRHDALRLLIEGAKALACVEHNGIAIDVAYLNDTLLSINSQIQTLEQSLQRDPLWKEWVKKYGEKAKLGSTDQLGQLLFVDLKYPCTEYTPTGKPKADENAIERVPLQFTKDYIHLKKLQKMKGTYLNGIKRETVDGFLHPVFNLHTVDTYRSSSSLINFQNLPMRNPEMMKVIRRCFIPRKGRMLVEIDFSGIEVRIAACYNHDPMLIHYIKNKATDMHRDMACELFLLPPELITKKTTRDASKNMFVFPQFYGSFYVDCARAIWTAMERRDFRVGADGISIREHLASLGITRLGDCNPDQAPVRGTFEHHVMKVEKKMWTERFSVYARWKNQWYQDYLNKGYFDMYTGFRCKGLYSRNQVINYPVQGSAFHCLLWSIIALQKAMIKAGMQSLIVGQIHDCIVLDVVPHELNAILNLAHRIMTVLLPRAWQWIIVPLETESEVCRIDQSWIDKRVYVKKEELGWIPAA